MTEQETIKFLQARLIERTEQSTATAYRDAQTIRKLTEGIKELYLSTQCTARQNEIIREILK